MRTTFILFMTMGFLSLEGFAQRVERISVEGIARIKEKPELIVVTANLIVKDKEYKTCFEKSLSSLNELKNVFQKNGIEPQKIKSEGLYISEEYKWTGNEREKIGFYSNIEFTIEEIFSNEFSQNLLSSLSTDGLDLNYKIKFEFSETQKEKIRKLALEKAIEDANIKAQIIAKASKLQLTGISKIEYNYYQKNFGLLDMEGDQLEMADEIMPITRQDFNFGTVDLNPKEKSISKVILMEWNYKKDE